jgi:hypothetical protein
LIFSFHDPYDTLTNTTMTPSLVSRALSLYSGLLKSCIIIALSNKYIIIKPSSTYGPHMTCLGTSPRMLISKSSSRDMVVLVGKMLESRPTVLLAEN